MQRGVIWGQLALSIYWMLPKQDMQLKLSLHCSFLLDSEFLAVVTDLCEFVFLPHSIKNASQGTDVQAVFIEHRKQFINIFTK